MKALKKTPTGDWEQIEIENTLDALQEAVGGYIETVTFSTDACLICNEEGAMLDLDVNITGLGIFFGTVLIVGVDGEEFTDAPDIMDYL